IQVDGEHGATAEDAVVADGSAAAAVGQDGQTVGTTRVVGIDVRSGGLRPQGVVVARGASDDRHAGEGSGAVAAGSTIAAAVPHTGVAGVPRSASCTVAQAGGVSSARTSDVCVPSA